MADEIEKSTKWTAGKIWKLIGIIIDIGLTIFLLVLSIIIASNISNKDELASATGFMGMVYYFMENPNVFLFSVVVPLFVLLVVNIVLTVYYYQKIAEKEKAEAKKTPTLDKLSEEQKLALRQQLLKEMKATEEKTEPVKTEETKPVEKVETNADQKIIEPVESKPIEEKVLVKKAPKKASPVKKTTAVKKTTKTAKPKATTSTAKKASAKKTTTAKKTAPKKAAPKKVAVKKTEEKK